MFMHAIQQKDNKQSTPKKSNCISQAIAYIYTNIT